MSDRIAELRTEIAGLDALEQQIEDCNRPIDPAAWAEWSEAHRLYRPCGPPPRWALDDLARGIRRQCRECERELDAITEAALAKACGESVCEHGCIRGDGMACAICDAPNMQGAA